MANKPFSLAVKAVIFDAEGRCLMIRRSAHNRNFVGCWECLGGSLRLSEEHDDSAWVPLGRLGERDLPARFRDFMLDYARREPATP